MKQFTKLIILAAILLVVNIPIVSAFSVNHFVSDPDGSLTLNAPVTVSYDVTFAPASDTTFPSGNDLVMTTELTDPEWTYVLILDGVENTRTPISAKLLDLSGFEVSYPSGIAEKIHVTLTGTVPGASTPSNVMILEVREVNNEGNTVSGTQIFRAAVVGGVAQPTPAIIAKMANPASAFDQLIGRFNGLFSR
jgi:hypothetical protein